MGRRHQRQDRAEAAHTALTFAYNPLIGVSAQCPGSVRTVWLRVYPPDQYVPALVRLACTASACTNGFETVFVGPAVLAGRRIVSLPEPRHSCLRVITCGNG